PGALLLSLCALACGLRLSCLFQPMRYAESLTYVWYAARPLYLLLCKYDFPNNHIFHSLCVKACCGVFGDARWAVRLPALGAGLFLVAATYAVARALGGRRAAMLSACLVACSSVLIEYSTNARGYSMVALLFLLMLGLACWLLGHRSL